MGFRSTVARRPLSSFVAIIFGFTWLFWFAAQIRYPSSVPPAKRAPDQLLMIVGSFGPFIGGVVVARVTGRWSEFKTRLLRWRVGVRWYFLVLALPVATFVAAYGVYRVLGGTPVNSASALPLTALPGVFLLTLFVGGGNEEPVRHSATPRPPRDEPLSHVVSADD